MKAKATQRKGIILAAGTGSRLQPGHAGEQPQRLAAPLLKSDCGQYLIKLLHE